MATLLIRTLIIYFFLILTMRLMGKRQIGELEISDLVTTFLLSEIAALPITNRDVPLTHSILPMITLLGLQVISAWLPVQFPKLRRTSARPTEVIRDGILDQKMLFELRITMDELMSEVRRQGLCDLSQVNYAILEKNGKLTILPKAEHLPPTCKQLDMTVKEERLQHIVWCDGVFSKNGLSLIGRDRAWLEKEVARLGLSFPSLFCITADRDGTLWWVMKEDKS